MEYYLKFTTEQMPIDGPASLVIVDTNKGRDIFISYADEYGTLVDPDSGDDLGWTIDSVTMWADITCLYESANPSLDRSFAESE
jgi:hypothetical protein